MVADEVGRIAFVTRRFYPLQGFRRVAFICWLLLVFWLFSHMESGRSPVGVVFSLTMCLGPTFIEMALKAYYGRRVGRVTQDSLAVWQWGLPMVIVIVVAIAYDLHFSGSGRPSIAALLLGSVALLDVIRDWPWRWYRAFALAACVTGSLLWALRPAPAHAALIAIGLIGAAEIITGYLDHRLLLGVLGPRRQTADDMEVLDGR